jgi:hypothetical protein
MLGCRALVLGWPFRSLTQRGGGVQRPVGVAQHLAGQENQIGLAAGNNRVGLRRIGNHAHRSGRHFGFLAYSRGERDLVTGADRDLYVRNHASRGAIDQIDAVRAKEMCELNGLVDIPSTLSPVGCGDAHQQRQMLRPFGADRVHNFQQQPSPVFKTPP